MASTKTLEMAATARDLRTLGLTYREIGERLGVGISRAHRLVTDPTDAKRTRRRTPMETPCDVCGTPIHHRATGRGAHKRFCPACVADRHRVANKIRWQTSKHAHNERRRVINLTPERAGSKRESSRMNYIRQGSTTSPAAIRILFYDPCSYCGGPTNLGVDHIEPIISGGSGDWDNLTACCLPCNIAKRERPLLHFLARRLELHG